MTKEDPRNEGRGWRVVAALTMRIALVALLTFAGGACREEGPAERAGEAIDEALEDAGDKVDDVVDEAKEEVEEEE
jgi:hypothetical protein